MGVVSTQGIHVYARAAILTAANLCAHAQAPNALPPSASAVCSID